MRVLCINAQPIEGALNLGLNLIKEGQSYNVIDSRQGNFGLAYDIGIHTPQHREAGFKTYWASERFVECSDDDYEESEEEQHLKKILETIEMLNFRQNKNV